MSAPRIAVIGAGVVGTLIARELCRYEAEVVILERQPDVGWGITKANSAIVHAGFHDAPDSVRARFCGQGNALFERLCEELAVPLLRVGSWVVALHKADLDVLKHLKSQGEANGIPGLEICPAEELRSREPALNPKILGGLWAPTAGITEPWALAIAAAENVLANEGTLLTEHEVTGLEVRSGRIHAVTVAGQRRPVDVVVNAAGLYTDRVAAMAGLECPPLTPRRGEYILLDKAVGGLVRSILFPAPNPASKGILVLPTVDGGILLGPTAEDLAPEAREATDTTEAGLRSTVEGARRLVPTADLSKTVKTFAGLRPESPSEDFLLGPTPVKGFYQAAAMRSPGLTAAPAVARWLVREVIAPEHGLTTRSGFNPYREAPRRPFELGDQTWAAMIREDPIYGHMVCHCNQVTEGEVVEAIRRGARTLDGVKFRTRAGFGRCQGGSCTDTLLHILARELGIDPQDVAQGAAGSTLLSGRVRP